MIIAELAEKAGQSSSFSFISADESDSFETTGLPKGVLSILHGSVPAVKFLCEEPRIKAISFVGSDRAGKYIYDTAGALGKRVQANLGAKSQWNVLIRLTRANVNVPLEITAFLCRTRTRILRSTLLLVLLSEVRHPLALVY